MVLERGLGDGSAAYFDQPSDVVMGGKVRGWCARPRVHGLRKV